MSRRCRVMLPSRTPQGQDADPFVYFGLAYEQRAAPGAAPSPSRH